MSNLKVRLWFLIVLSALTLDQISKYWARTSLSLGVEYPVLRDILSWELAFNTGAAFSVFSGKTFWLTMISASVSVLLLIYSWRVYERASHLYMSCLGFLIAGSTGNLIDRLLFHQVTDFINFLLLPGDFPIFNVADICINIAVGLFILDTVLRRR